MILISDGYDEHSHASFEEALAAVKSAGITIYVVGIGGVAGISLKGERELKRLANETGGRVFFPPRAEELAGVYDQLAADAQNRYLVTYTPTNTARDGALARRDLSTPSEQYVVRTRAGYRAPKPPPIRPTLEFTVTDLSGQYVEISADDLVVSEDGVDQKVDTFHEAETPLSIVLALDSSGSMRKTAEALMAAARTFVEALRPRGQAVAALLLGRRARRARPWHQPPDEHRRDQRIQGLPAARRSTTRWPGRSRRSRPSRGAAPSWS